MNREEDAVQRAGEGFDAAGDTYADAIDHLPNAHDRFDAYTEAGKRAAKAVERYAAGRNGAAVDLRTGEHLTLEKLAERLGVSVPRAHQIVRAGEAARQEGASEGESSS